jgi:site-specific DNA-methyltransferase (adenine-specific)
MNRIKSEVFNEDCKTGMRKFPDKYFHLAIVDPPYGINFGTYNRTNKDSQGNRFKANKYHHGNWDTSTPDDEYFFELKRVSENQIVWGGNYFIQLAGKPTPNLKTAGEFRSYIKESDQNWIFWHKQNPVPNFADGELAWISMEGQGKEFPFKYYGNLEGNTSAETKIHPTQKPIKLYEWLLDTYAKPGFRILDTHLGSGSHRIAAHNRGFEFTGFEISGEYYEEAQKRFHNAIKQLDLFGDLFK